MMRGFVAASASLAFAVSATFALLACSATSKT